MRTTLLPSLLVWGCASTAAQTPPPPPPSPTSPSAAVAPPPAPAADASTSVATNMDGIERISLGNGRERLIVTGYFHPDDAAIEPRFTALLTKLAKLTRSANIDLVEVHGYADDEGSTQYNLSIADRRAQGVARYLQTLDGRLLGRVVTHGDSAPEVGRAGDEEDHPRNRRVVARVDLTWPATARR